MKLISFIKRDGTIIAFIVTGLLLLLAAAISFSWNDFHINTDSTIDSAKVAQFGDFVGGLVGSIWALAGVLLFYKALTEQRTDFKNNENALKLQVDALNQQIEEFKQSRQEQVNSRKVYEEQSKILKTQQMESNFYSLLDVYRKIKSSIEFRNLIESLDKNYDPENNSIKRHETIINSYGDLFLENREQLSHYFRIIYRIIRIIDSNNQISEKEKHLYTNILRAQLTDYEIILLYYNSHTSYGEKTRSLILKYNLLKHLPLFSTPGFKFFVNKQRDNALISLTREADKFLSKHIGLYYDVESVTDKMEEKLDSLDLYIGIYFSDHIDVKIISDVDISNSGINLSDDDFLGFIQQIIYERVVFNRYLPLKFVDIKKSTIKTDEHKEFCITISSDQQLTLNKDEY